VVGIDAEPALAELPWELLSGLEGHPLFRSHIVRLATEDAPWRIEYPDAFPDDARAAFLEGMVLEDDPLRAVEGARQAVRDQRGPWWMPRVVLSDRSIASRTVLWERAAQIGRSSGYLGVEHLLMALCERPDGAWLRSARSALDHIARAQPVFVGPWSGPTPRVQQLTRLPGSVLRVPWVARALPPAMLRGAPPAAGGHAWEQPVPAGAGMLLEVWGGPEDGRRVTLLHRTSHLGRWTEDASALGPRLYGPEMASDPSLSRQHLQYLGPGQLLVLAPTRINGTPVKGAVEVRPGDRLELGRGTTLEVLRP
jgi:hypothetical protein